MTTLYCILYLDDALWTPGFSSAIIAHKRDTLDKIFNIIERAYKGLPDSIKPKTRQDTLRMLRFESRFDGMPLDSEIYVAMELRGGTVQALHITERAWIEGEKAQELEDGSKEAVPLTGRISEETTANGMNSWYDSFMEAWNEPSPGPLDYHAFFYPWHEHGEYQIPGSIDEYSKEDLRLKEMVREAFQKELTDEQLLWYRWKLNQKRKSPSQDLSGLRPEQSMRQEYPSTVMEAFQSGLGNVFDSELLNELTGRPPIEVLPNGARIWQKPVKRGDPILDPDGDPIHTDEGEVETEDLDRPYVLASDPAGGDAGDETVIDVWDTESMEQVAQWSSAMVRPDEAAGIAADLARMYNNAYAGIENNQISMMLFFAKIYDNYYFTTTLDEKRQKRTKKLGWNTNTKTRDLMIDEYRMHFEEGSLTINSRKTIDQMRTFVKKEGGKREHADGKRDDAVIAAMIAVQMFKFHRELSIRKRRTFAKPAGL